MNIPTESSALSSDCDSLGQLLSSGHNMVHIQATVLDRTLTFLPLIPRRLASFFLPYTPHPFISFKFICIYRHTAQNNIRKQISGWIGSGQVPIPMHTTKEIYICHIKRNVGKMFMASNVHFLLPPSRRKHCHFSFPYLDIATFIYTNYYPQTEQIRIYVYMCIYVYTCVYMCICIYTYNCQSQKSVAVCTGVL